MSRRMYAQAASLFAAGAVIGGIVAGTVGASAASPSPSPSAARGYGDPGHGPGMYPGMRPGRPPFGPGQTGTVTAVDAAGSTVTIKTPNGTKTYTVDANSDIDKNGEASLSDLKVGDAVHFGVRRGTSTIAVLHAGDEAKNMPGGRGRHGNGPCDGDGPHGPGPGPRPTPTATQSSTT